MRTPLLIAATSALLLASACSSSAKSDSAAQSTSASTDPTGSTVAGVATTVAATNAPVTTVACRVVEGRRDSKLYPGDCDGSDLSVSLLQESLNYAGYAVPVTGLFDTATSAAVKAFQAAAGLEADGLVGPLTWGALPNPDEIGDDEFYES